MRIYLSVDPGIRGCGCAIFVDGELRAAAYVRNPDKTGAGPGECQAMAQAIRDWFVACSNYVLNILVLEWPQTYGGRAKRGDANDLFPLAGVDAALAANFPAANVTHYLPREWKGTVDPDVMIERIQGRLAPHELLRVELPSAKSLEHNVWDAVGIGLKYLGRLERQRKFSRE